MPGLAGLRRRRPHDHWPETWQSGTRCHGWSSTPTRDLIVHTLGIGPAEPGFTRARVAPRLGTLDWANGAAPTPVGLLDVRARGERIEIDTPLPTIVERPDGRTVELAPGNHVIDE